MTLYLIDGFETYGNKSTTDADLQSNLDNTIRVTHTLGGGGHIARDLAIIDDFETQGFAFEFPTLSAGRSEYIVYENPDSHPRLGDFVVPTNGLALTFCTGFRFFNASQTPAQDTEIFTLMTSAVGLAASVDVSSNEADLIYYPMSGSSTTISSVLTADTWHYLEFEYKFTTSGNGGYMKVFVDGVEQANITSSNVASATFYNTYGFRIGCNAGSNQTAGTKYAFDDVYSMSIDGVDHTAPLGPVRVIKLAPSSDATPNNWSPDIGTTNYTQVDNQNWDNTSYVEAATTADDDHYGLETLGTVDTVHCLQIDVVAQAIDGTPNLHVGFDNGTADEEDLGAIGSQSQDRALFDADPSGSAWTVSSVNSVEATQRMTE